MSIPSNLYAEKVFSEHPTALWALDDQVDYVSLISENQRNFSNWDISNGTSSVVVDVIDEPFISSVINKVFGTPSEESLQSISCVGPDLFNFTTLNPDLGTFSVSSYIYSLTPYITGLDIGYEYYDSTTGTNIQNLKHYDTSVYDQWIFISETFHIPSDNTTMRPVINIYYIDGSTDSSSYKFLINGISVGQWSEEFNTFSLGIDTIQLPENINLPELHGVEAKAYGLQVDSGYYISDETSLAAKNSGLPLVYGSSNTTVLVPNDMGYPGLIVPGKGFLNSIGKYKDYTCEMWLKVDADTNINRRIFGPISSDDGLYVNGAFIVLKINNNIGSFFIGEWSRPMLIHIRMTKNSANLLINGEQVISLNFITDDLVFPNEFTGTKSNDWLGFYGHEDVSPIAIDCVGIYPYQVPSVVAKKRFVYGQGVEIPENINRAYSGSSVFIDYPFSNYTNNYNYPDIGKWSKGILNNLIVENNKICAPRYNLPVFVSSNKSLNNLYSDNFSIQNEFQNFFTFKPNETWSSENSYLLFDTIDPITDSVKTIWGIFKYSTQTNSPQTLIRIQDEITNNYISIDLVNNIANYSVTVGSETTLLYASDSIIVGNQFTVGINLSSFSNYFGGEVAQILGNRNSLKVYVGGNKKLENTFIGKIYSVGFDNEFNHSKIANLFDEKGVPTEYLNVFNSYDGPTDYDAGYEYFGNDISFWEYIIDGGDPSSYSTTKLETH